MALEGSPSDALSETSATARSAFRPSSAMRVGAELEWLIFHAHDLSKPVSADETRQAAAGALPAAGVVTIEPGGQLELSTQPFSSPEQLLDATAVDVATLVTRFRERGLALVNLGLDPIRPAHRTLHVSRYEAMEEYFRVRSPAGLRMMSSTASLQLNVDFGSDPERRWRRAQAIAPLFLAAFANSPTLDGGTFGVSSARQQVWAATDPTRTRPVGAGVESWVDYVLDAQVMLRRHGSTFEPQVDELDLRSWLQSGAPPPATDVEDHINTLFPPLRPRGYLEFRMLDALPESGRAAAIATVWSLLIDETAGRCAEEAAVAVPDLWDRAVAAGLADPDVSRTAMTCLDLAADAADRSNPRLAHACRAWRHGRVSPVSQPSSVEELITGLIEP